MTRLYVWLIVCLIGAYDLAAIALGIPTISATVRHFDVASGGIVRWVLLGFWCHFFLPRPFGGWTSDLNAIAPLLN